MPERVRSSGLGVCSMTHRLDVVPIWPDDECAVVVWVILRPQARGAIVFATSCKRRSVELSDLFAMRCRKGNVYWSGAATERPEPEVALALAADHCPAFAFSCDADTEWLEGLDEEFLCFWKVGDVEANVIKDHERSPVDRADKEAQRSKSEIQATPNCE